MKIYERPRGFTLVELLVVIAIIAVLASLIMVSGSAAFRAARESATRMEMTSIERALEAYKTKYGEYPPDFSDYDAFERHFKKRWPRVTLNTYIPDGAGSDPYAKRTDGIRNAVNAALGTTFAAVTGEPYTFPAEIKLSAIAFWLGGLPAPGDPTVLAGFGPSDNPFCLKSGVNPPQRDDNPSNPVITAPTFTNEKLREKPLYDFSVALRNLPDASKLSTEGYRFLINEKPVAYFRGTTLTTRAGKNHAYLQKPPTFVPAGYDPTLTGTPPDYNNPVKHIEFTGADGQPDEVTPYALKTTNTTGGTPPPITPPTLISANIDWHNVNSFQIIHPGADGRFSTLDSSLPVPNCRPIAVTDEGQEGLTFEDLDNITNCGSSATIQGIIGK